MFVRCSRDVTVQVVDQFNNPLEKAEVSIDYDAHFFPWLTQEEAFKGVTNDKGVAVVRDMPCSVWSYIFYRSTPMTVAAEFGSLTGTEIKPFHTTDKVIIKINIPDPQGDAQVQVIDDFTQQPIANADVLITIDGSGQPVLHTDSQGLVSVPGLSYRSLVSGAARHPNYNSNDTTLVNRRGVDLIGSTVTIPLSPKVQCNQEVEYNSEFKPKTVMSNIDLGKDSGVFTLTYRTLSLADRFVVKNAKGKVLHDTGFVSTGDDFRNKDVTFDTRMITIEAYNCPDDPTSSVWTLIPHCPKE
jgi:hypothetical protein